MATTQQDAEALLGRGLYTVADAARLLQVPSATVRRWLLGYSYRMGAQSPRSVLDRSGGGAIGAISVHGGRDRRHQPPVVTREAGERFRYVTFIDLVELLVIHGFRQAGVSLPRIRIAAETAASLFDVRHPLAFRRFRTDGRDVFAEVQEREDMAGLINLSRGGQKAFPDVVELYLTQLDYELDSELAVRWWPRGRDARIVVDPRIAFGAPHIADQGIPTSALWEMVEAGDPTEETARWFGVEAADVEAAVEYERELQAA